MDVIEVALVGAVQLIGEVRRLHAERPRQAALIPHQHRTRVEWRGVPEFRVYGFSIVGIWRQSFPKKKRG